MLHFGVSPLKKILKSASIIFPYRRSYFFLASNFSLKNTNHPLKSCLLKDGFISQITGKQSALTRAVWRFSLNDQTLKLRCFPKGICSMELSVIFCINTIQILIPCVVNNLRLQWNSERLSCVPKGDLYCQMLRLKSVS